ncbi:MAG: hypothetical protein RIT15_814 [Pseudomonadota bacterium]
MKKLLSPKNLVALLAGLLFALGLVLSGMTQPAKVIGFLNIAGILEGGFLGTWDPTLAFVMGGALLVTLFAFAITPRHGRRPWFAEKFELPTRKDIDIKLIGGAALFGVGWALAGYCPGPAFASLYAGGTDIVIFMAALIAGMYLATRLTKR